MKTIRIDSSVLKNPESKIEHVNAYLQSVYDRQESPRLDALWDEACETWRPVVAKWWGMLNPGKNLFMRKVEQGKAELPESKNATRTLVGDDIPEEGDDGVLIQEQEEIDPSELTETNVPITGPVKRGRGRPRKNPLPQAV